MNTSNTVQEWLAGLDRRHAELHQYVSQFDVREREARARFTDEPLTGFGPMEPGDTEATETTQ